MQEKPFIIVSIVQILSLLSVSIKGFNDDHVHFLKQIIPIR
jgi:hypothetical protein